MVYWSGEGLYGISAVDLVSWGLFTVLSLVLLWYVLRNTFPVLILRDSLNREKRQLHERYFHLKDTSETLHYQIHLARQEGRAGEAASLQQQLDEIDSECKQIASAIGRVRKTAAKSD